MQYDIVTHDTILSVCTKLPKDWIGLRTDTDFPVEQGTEITLSCRDDLRKSGEFVITCNTYLNQDFQFNRQLNIHCDSMSKFEYVRKSHIRKDVLFI